MFTTMGALPKNVSPPPRLKNAVDGDFLDMPLGIGEPLEKLSARCGPNLLDWLFDHMDLHIVK